MAAGLWSFASGKEFGFQNMVQNFIGTSSLRTVASILCTVKYRMVDSWLRKGNKYLPQTNFGFTAAYLRLFLIPISVSLWVTQFVSAEI